MANSDFAMHDYERVDQLSDEFEVAFRAGENPRIEAFLQRAPDLRDALLIELVRLEIELRQEADETLSLEEYRDRFPDAAAAIEEATGPRKPTKITSKSSAASLRKPFTESGEQFPRDFGDYRLIRKIGEGGMGIVYEAEQKSLGNRRLAIKTIRTNYGLGDNSLKRFRNEVQAVAQLEHRHIVPVFHLGVEADTHYFAMKYIDGRNLSDLISSLRSALGGDEAATKLDDSTDKQNADLDLSTHRSSWSKDDTLASAEIFEKVSRSGTTGHPKFVEQLARMGYQIATALHHVHDNGVVHRDVKPANLLLDTDGDVWLTDFGLAMIRDNPSLTQPGGLIGTYHYMSPEQAMGSKRVIVDHRSDIFSLGVTLYELLTLRRAFPGSSREEILRAVQFGNPPPVRKLAPKVPRDLETIVMKAMAKAPNARFQSAASMAAELKLFQQGKPLTIRRPSFVERFSYWAREHRQMVAALGISVSAIFIAAIITAVVALQARANTQLALQAETEQRKKTETQLTISEGLRLAANSLLVSKKDETLALLLAVEAAAKYKTADINDAIMHALNIGHAAQVFVGHEERVGGLAFSNDSQRLISSSRPADFGQHQEPAIIWGTQNGEKLGELTYESAITSATFGPKDKRILTASSPTARTATNDLDMEDPENLAAPPVLWSAESYGRQTVFNNSFLFHANASAFSPDGERVVLPTRGNKATIHRCEGGAVLIPLVGHEARVIYAGFHPTKNQVVTASDDNTVRIWNGANGEEILKLDVWQNPDAEEQKGSIEWVKFSPNGQILVTGSLNRGIQLWDLTKDAELINKSRIERGNAIFLSDGDLLLSHGYPSASAIIRYVYDDVLFEEIDLTETIPIKILASPDSQVASKLQLSDRRAVLLWDLKRHAARSILTAGSYIDNIAMSPNSQYVAACSADKRVRLWFVENGVDRVTIKTQPQIGLPIVAKSPDGKSIAIASDIEAQAGALCRFDAAPQTLSLDGRITLPVVGGERILVSKDNRLSIYDARDGRYLELQTKLRDRVFETAINQTGDRVAVTLKDNSVVLWTLGENPRRVPLHVGTTVIRKLLFSLDDKELFGVSEDGHVFAWNLETGESRSTNIGGFLLEFEFSPDGSQLAVVSLRHDITTLNRDSLKVIHQLPVTDTRFSRVHYSADGKYLLAFAASTGTAARLYDVESGEIIRDLENDAPVLLDVHPSEPEALLWSTSGAFLWRFETDEKIEITDRALGSGAYSSDGSRFYLGTRTPRSSAANGIETWPENVEQPSVQQWTRDGLEAGETILFSFGSIHRLQARNDGKLFVNLVHRSHVEVHDVASRETVATIDGHYATVSSCFFTADSRRMITTSWDGRVTIWDAATGALQSTRDDHQTPILTAAISDDRKWLVTGGRDGSCLIWNLVDGSVSDRIQVADAALRHVAFDPDTNRFLGLSSDGQAHVINRETSERLSIDFNFEKIDWAEFSPAGQSILIVPGKTEDTDPRQVLVMPLDGSEAKSIAFPNSDVLTSHFHPTENQILTATRDGTVYLTNLDSGETEMEFIHQAGTIFSATFDAGAKYIYVTGRSTGTVWRLSDGRRWMTTEDMPYGKMMRHTWNPFLPGTPRQFLTRRPDNRLYRRWPLDPEAAASQRVTRELTEDEKKRYLSPIISAEPVEADGNSADINDNAASID